MITTDDLYQRWLEELTRTDAAPDPVLLASLEMVGEHYGMDMCGELETQQLLADDPEIQVLRASRIKEGSRVEFYLCGESYEGIAQDWMRNPLERNDPLIQVNVHGTTTILAQSELEVVDLLEEPGDETEEFGPAGDLVPDVVVVMEKTGFVSSAFDGPRRRRDLLWDWELGLEKQLEKLADFEFAEPAALVAAARREKILELTSQLTGVRVLKRLLEDGLLAGSGALRPLVARVDTHPLNAEFEALHPRGKDGKFIEKLGFVSFLDRLGHMIRGQVKNIDNAPDGSGSRIWVQPLDNRGHPRGGLEMHRPSELTSRPKVKADLEDLLPGHRRELATPKMGSDTPDINELAQRFNNEVQYSGDRFSWSAQGPDGVDGRPDGWSIEIDGTIPDRATGDRGSAHVSVGRGNTFEEWDVKDSDLTDNPNPEGDALNELASRMDQGLFDRINAGYDGESAGLPDQGPARDLAAPDNLDARIVDRMAEGEFDLGPNFKLMEDVLPGDGDVRDNFDNEADDALAAGSTRADDFVQTMSMKEMRKALGKNGGVTKEQFIAWNEQRLADKQEHGRGYSMTKKGKDVRWDVPGYQGPIGEARKLSARARGGGPQVGPGADEQVRKENIREQWPQLDELGFLPNGSPIHPSLWDELRIDPEQDPNGALAQSAEQLRRLEANNTELNRVAGITAKADDVAAARRSDNLLNSFKLYHNDLVDRYDGVGKGYSKVDVPSAPAAPEPAQVDEVGQAFDGLEGALANQDYASRFIGRDWKLEGRKLGDGTESWTVTGKDNQRSNFGSRQEAEAFVRGGEAPTPGPASQPGAPTPSPDMTEALGLPNDASYEDVIKAFQDKAKAGDKAAADELRSRLVGSRWTQLDDKRTQNLDLNQGPDAWDGELVTGRNGKVLAYAVPRGGGLGDGELETFDNQDEAKTWLEERLTNHRVPWLPTLEQHPDTFDGPAAEPAAPDQEWFDSAFGKSIDFWDKLGPEINKWDLEGDWGDFQVLVEDNGEPYLRVPGGDGTWEQTFLDRHIDPDTGEIQWRVTNGFYPEANGMDKPKWDTPSTKTHDNPLDAVRDLRSRSGQSTDVPGSKTDGFDQVRGRPDQPTPETPGGGSVPREPTPGPEPAQPGGTPGPAAPRQGGEPAPLPAVIGDMGIDQGRAEGIPVVDGGKDADGNHKIIPDGQPDQFSTPPSYVAVVPGGPGGDDTFQVYDRTGTPRGTYQSYDEAIFESMGYGWAGSSPDSIRTPEELSQTERAREEIVTKSREALPANGDDGIWHPNFDDTSRMLPHDYATRVTYRPFMGNQMYVGTVYQKEPDGKWVGSWNQKRKIGTTSGRSVQEFDTPEEAMHYVKTGVDKRVDTDYYGRRDRERPRARPPVNRPVPPLQPRTGPGPDISPDQPPTNVPEPPPAPAPPTPNVPEAPAEPNPPGTPEPLLDGEIGVRTAPQPAVVLADQLRYGTPWDAGAVDVVKSPRYAFAVPTRTGNDSRTTSWIKATNGKVPTKKWADQVLGDTSDRWDQAGIRMPGVVSNVPLMDYGARKSGGNFMAYGRDITMPRGHYPSEVANMTITSNPNPRGTFSNQELGDRVAITTHEMGHVMDNGLAFSVRHRQGQPTDRVYGHGGVLSTTDEFKEGWDLAVRQSRLGDQEWVNGLKNQVNLHVQDPLAKEMLLAYLDTDAPTQLRGYVGSKIGYYMDPMEIWARTLPQLLERRLRRRGHTQEADNLKGAMQGQYIPGYSAGGLYSLYTIGGTISYGDAGLDRTLDALESILDSHGLLDNTAPESVPTA